MNMINTDNTWNNIRQFNQFSERKKQGEITTMDIELMLGYVFNCSYQKVKDITLVFSIQNNIGINFFTFFKDKAKRCIEYFNEHGKLTDYAISEIKDLFENAIKAVDADTLIKVGNKKDLLDYYMKYLADKDLSRIYKNYKECFNLDKLINRIIKDNNDIRYYEGNYYRLTKNNFCD